MAPKKKNIKPAAKVSSKSPSQGAKKINMIVARVLILVVLLGCVWEFLQTLNKEVPKLKAAQILKLNGQIKGASPFVPWGAAALGPDKIAVADNQNNRILLFDRAGNFIKSWGKLGEKADQFHEPSGMTTDGNGNLFVIDAWNSAIKGFDDKGKQIANIDLSKLGFFGPRGITFNGTNFVIADTGSHRLVVVSPKGEIVSSWEGKGNGENQLKGPLAVAADQKGNYFVADTENNRLQWLDANGKKIRYSKLDGQVNSVAVDNEGRVYVGTKVDDGQVRVFDPQGRVLGSVIDQSGSAEPFKDAKFITVTPDDLLLVTSGDSVYLYRLPAFGQK